jgi:hypothetical protein
LTPAPRFDRIVADLRAAVGVDPAGPSDFERQLDAVP